MRWLAVVAVLLAACADSPTTAVKRAPSTTATANASPAQSTTTSTTTTTSTATTSTATARAPSTTAATPAELRRLTGTQAIVVRAGAYGRTTATLTVYERVGDSWRVVLGPWSAYVGRAGVAPAGEKREGDGRTPSGTYPFDFMFGIDPDPGVKFPFRRITGHNIVWSDDPESPRYNMWVDTNQADAGPSPESMYVRPQYDLGAVIAYNVERTPGLGSGIFIHVSAGRPTAGCVSLPRSQLTRLLTWLDPARSPAIVIGV